jgi:hypothetical protein
MTQIRNEGLDEALVRVEQARNAVSRAKKRNGGMLRADQTHLVAELETAQRRLDQAELRRSRQILAAKQEAAEQARRIAAVTGRNAVRQGG